MPRPDGPQFNDDELNYLRALRGQAQEQAEWESKRRQQPVNLNDKIDLQKHLIDAHGVDLESTQYYDESLHDVVPKLYKRKRDWSQPTVPQLDHEDLANWHHHEHTHGEFAQDYPHTTLDNKHFHHE